MRITLQRPHTHAGQSLSAGTELTLDDDTARWLINQGVATPSPIETPPQRGNKKDRNHAGHE
ncbi:DUF7210 family protein [Chitinimonas lacunae]|uniref:DUF7210 domain-containing protein n=1 Tax=Chitinimonas lacunae TaxID=1963018 RepID=A0ABV8MYC8_9NEIS